MKFNYQTVIQVLSEKISMLEVDNAIMRSQLEEIQKETQKDVPEND